MAELESILMGGGSNSSAWDELYKWYVDNRILVINASIDDAIIEDYLMYIIRWNKEDKDLPVDKRKPIRIFVSSPGGNVFNGNVFIDIISASKTPIWGIALDLVASAAYCSFLACHERFGLKNSSFLQHEGQISIENSRSKAKQTSEFLDKMEDKAKEFILSRTNFTSEQYDEAYDVEYWMDAQKAKELGVINKIIGVDCDLDDVL